MRVELRVTPGTVSIFTVGAQPEALCRHVRAIEPGTWVVDHEHWKDLPGPHDVVAVPLSAPDVPVEELLAARSKKAFVVVARRDLATYDAVGRSA
jgi:hypothetical protein